ncbi:MAG: hypothetical protein ABI602_04505 [Candidatus Saccharibacteria bacterium]
MGRRTYIFASLLVLLVSLLLPSAPARALSGGFNLTTSPSPISLATSPGSTVTSEFRVLNNAPQLEHLKVGLMKFRSTGETGRPNLYDRGPGDSYFDWIKFTPSSFDAPTGQWVKVKMTITVPTTASLGYYYAVTFQRSTNAAPLADQTASVIGASATLVLLDVVTPNQHPKLTIANFTSDHHVYQYLPATLSIRVHNTGNIHMHPGGNIFIKRGGKTVATLDVNPYQGNILPASYRVFTADWRDGFPIYQDKQADGKPTLTKSGLPDRSLHWDLTKVTKLRFGKYTAQALVVYNDGTRDVPLEATTSFWVIPWTFLLIGLSLILFVVAGMWFVGRHLLKSTTYRGRV